MLKSFANFKFKMFLLILIGTFSMNQTFGCHAIALVNFNQQTINATSITVNAASDSPTCGCATYWLDLEVRCINQTFDAVPFNPGFWGPLSTYPYFQSAQMNKPNCVVQNYPGITIPFAGLCPGTVYQYRMRENHNGQVGPWCPVQTFTTPGVMPTFTASINTSNNNICAGNCVTITAAPTGGCQIAVNYSWNTGATTPSITVCPNVTTNYTCTVTDVCSNQQVVLPMTINVVPLPVAGTASVNPTSVCSGDPVTLTLTGSAGGVQWQSAPNSGGPFTNMAGATTTTFNTAGLTSNTCFRAEVTGCGSPVYSNVVCVTINPTPTVTIPAVSTCAGSPATLTPNVSPAGGTYSWNTGPTTATLTDSPATTTTYTLTYTANGCPQTATGTINVNPLPTVSVNTVNICNGAPGVLTATPSVGGGSYSWSNGATTQSITDSPPVSTTYTVTYTLNGCSATGSGMINIGVDPQPSFTAPPNCDGNVISFFDNTVGSLTAWEWDFGDGSPIDNNQNPTHLYASAGTYNVTLTAYEGPCSGSTTIPVTVLAMPVPSFTITPDCATQQTSFTSTSTISSGTITVLNWDITGGTPSTATGVNASTIFNTPGTYNVELYVESNNGCADSITQTVVIPAVPVADFTFVEECLGTPTCFTDASTVTGSTINGWNWDFNDGNTATTQNPCNNYAAGGAYNVTLTVTAANGCTSLPVTIPVNAYVTPIAGFTTSPVCFNEITQFTNTSTSSLTYQWDFGDGNTSTLTNPTHIYIASGSYTVTLTAITGLCSDVITQNVVVNPSPIANFNVTPACPNLSTQFNDLSTVSTGTITNWDWIFTNGTPASSTVQNPGVIYSNGGNFSAELIVTTNNGCQDTFSLTYNIPFTPDADFSFAPVCVGNPTCFTDLSLVTNSSITGWSWNFDDGSPLDNTQNPCHNYALDGNYNVSLTVTSADGCVSAPRVVPTVVYPLPIASFTVTDVCQSTAAIFTNTSNGATNYDWDFGDGNTASTQNTSHQYAAAGTYNVTITISSGSGCSDVFTAPVTIFPMPTANFVATNVCLNNNPMSFTDNSSVATGNITNWDWNFGDSQTSTIQNPTNNYNADGTFNVTLLVTTDNNCTNSVTQPVTVYPVPNVAFTPTNVCLNATSQFINSTTINSGTITAYNWDFGNGSGTSSQMTPTYVYGADGNYNVTLTATSDNGCINTLTLPLSVYPNPVVSFTADDVDGCNTHCVNFTNTSTINSGTNSSFTWFFGINPSGDANVENPSYCFSNTTANVITYIAQLNVISDQGCEANLTVNNYITVYPDVVAEFDFGPQPTTILNNTINFSNQTINGTTYSWDFDNGLTSTQINPSTTYGDIGTYDVVLIATSQYGCVDSIHHFVEIGPDFIIYVPNTFTPDGDGINDVFFPSLEGYDPQRFNMQIFNRWGDLIYETSFAGVTTGWDGMYKGIRAKDDTYVWKIRVKDIVYGKEREFVGHVNLLR